VRPFTFLAILFVLFLQINATRVYFYTPHQGDDYLALSLAISSQIAQGNSIQVILYGGAGVGDPSLSSIFGAQKSPCPLKDLNASFWENDQAYQLHQNSLDANGYHEGISLTDTEIQIARNQEFIASMSALGITRACVQSLYDFDFGCYIIWQLDALKLLDNNKQGFWGDTLTRGVYNLIANNEIRNPGSIHACVGSPRDCDANGQSKPENLACWYAAKQLSADAPTGTAGSWQFQFYLDQLPYATAADTVITADEVAQKLQLLGSGTPIITNLVNFLSNKKSSGLSYKQWDPTQEFYALGLHSFYQSFPSAESNTNSYSDTFAIFTVSGITPYCPGDTSIVVPPVSSRVPSLFALSGLPSAVTVPMSYTVIITICVVVVIFVIVVGAKVCHACRHRITFSGSDTSFL